MQSRYYDPAVGRFINTDDTSILVLTQGELLGTNLYAYCENNCVNYSDPTGCVKTHIQFHWWGYYLYVSHNLIKTLSDYSSLVSYSLNASKGIEAVSKELIVKNVPKYAAKIAKGLGWATVIFAILSTEVWIMKKVDKGNGVKIRVNFNLFGPTIPTGIWAC